MLEEAIAYEGEWYATDKMPIGNVILTDSTMTYEVILVEEKDIR